MNTRNSSRFTIIAALFLSLFALAVSSASAQQVHELYYNNSFWADSNLKGATTESGSGLGAVVTPGNGLHSFYLAHNDDVHQLYNVGGGWTDQDLTRITRGAAANSISNVAAVAVQNEQYVFYISDIFDPHLLFYNNSTWTDTNLQNYGLPQSDGQEVAAYATPNNGIHMFYVTPGPRVIQGYNVGNGWEYQDMTQFGAAQPEGTSLTAFSVGNLQYCFYVAFGGYIHELFYNNSTWKDTNLTALTRTVPSWESPDGSVSAMIVPGTKKLLVYYIGSNNHVIQLSSGNNVKWIGLDLTKKVKGPLANPAQGAIAFATTPNKQIHVFYAVGNHINQLFQAAPNKWQNFDLTDETDGGLAFYNGQMAGFSIGNEQHVYYLAQ